MPTPDQVRWHLAIKTSKRLDRLREFMQSVRLDDEEDRSEMRRIFGALPGEQADEAKFKAFMRMLILETGREAAVFRELAMLSEEL
jgi:hypothetical protein